MVDVNPLCLLFWSFLSLLLPISIFNPIEIRVLARNVVLKIVNFSHPPPRRVA